MGAGILPPRMMNFELSVACTGMIGALPKSPPNSTLSPTSLPGTGMTRTAVVLLLIMPMAASAAVMAAVGGAGGWMPPPCPCRRAAEAGAAETMTSGCILVLDVDTAQVRASVSLPGYDPDNIAASLDEAGSPLLDRTLAAHAVGSVFKPVLAAAALEAGLDGLTVECPG